MQQLHEKIADMNSRYYDPVSYTHLDVYKRQEKKESPIGVLWGWGKPYHGKFIGSIIPVSYTHLDVYKRQAQERVDTMLHNLMEGAGVTEELKACDPMRWVGLMNTLKAQAEEIIQDELIYK